MPLYERVGMKPDIGLKKKKLGTYKSGEKGKGRVWMMVIMKILSSVESKGKRERKRNFYGFSLLTRCVVSV